VNRIKIIDLGFLDYKNSWNYQKELQKKVLIGDCSDSIIFVEHDSVYTFGKNSDKSNLLISKDSKIKIYETERGGEITYHGPGQIVCYPILNLKNFKQSVTWYMRALEEVIIETLKLFDIKATRKDGLTGVWVKDEKIGAQGVRMTKWVTMHGFALNVNTDLRFFNDIIPCGIKDFGVTSIEKIIGKEQDLSLVKEHILISFAKVFNIKGYI
jgi:lipoyl(octanoyl) transferase|tara:strand:- start:2266 stop:2901 length:636 start_codon:yes stop_codon:yes gene_type:complete